MNLLSGRRYRGANPVLLTLGLNLRGSALPYWCGFAEAKALALRPRARRQPPAPAPNGAAEAADLGEQLAAMFTEHADKLGGGKP